MSAVRSTPGGRARTPNRPLAGVPTHVPASGSCLRGRAARASHAARPSNTDALPAGPRDLPPTAQPVRALSRGPATLSTCGWSR